MYNYYCRCMNTEIWGSVGPPPLDLWGHALTLHGIRVIQTKNTKTDYAGSGHPEAKDPTSCG
jgi:hypothetical protein